MLEVNTTAAREHIAKSERQSFLMRERARFSTSDMLDCGIKYLHKQFVIHMVYTFFLWLNAFPLK